MLKVDKTVKKETAYVALSSVILSALMQSVFLILKLWDYTVLLGNLWGIFISVFNFFLMGITVQKALQKEKKQAQNLIKTSQTARMFMIFVLALVGILVKIFNIYAVLIPLLFPRVWITFRTVIERKKNNNKEESE